MKHFWPRISWLMVSVVALAGLLILAYGLPPAELEVFGRPGETGPNEGRRRDASFIAIGDIMLGRHIRTLTEEEGRDYPFRAIGPFLRGADFVWANLEGPVLRNATITPLASMKFAFTPESAELLSEFNIKVASLGNNHTLDQGPEGYSETRELLDAAGVRSHGHPVTVSAEISQVSLEEGWPLRLIALNATWPNFRLEEAHELIRSASAQGRTFVMIHWGEEYEPVANERQRSIARTFIDAGATAVFGHHPHVAQDIESYRGRMIFYSLGNFVFDQYFSKETQEGLAVRVELKEAEIRYGLFPYDIRRGQPALMTETASAAWLEELAGKSSASLTSQIEAGAIITKE